MNSLIIVGGGITGLAAAYLAAKAGIRVTLLESSTTVGGLLGTFAVGGTRLEWFYHHAFTHDGELRWLLRELNIEDRLEFRPGSMGVFSGGRAYAFNSPIDLLRFEPMHLADKIRFAATTLYLAHCAKWQDREAVPALEWFYQNAGSRATQTLWEPLLRVKFGSHADKVPLAWMIGRMRQRVNSRRGGEEELGYIRGSLHVLLEALLKALEKMNVQVRTNARVAGIELEQNEIKNLQTTDGPISADAYLFTIPTTHLAELLQPINSVYAAELSRIEYFGAVCTILELNRPLGSVYWLNIADTTLPFGGIIEHTNLVPADHYSGTHLVYLSRYFSATDDLAKLTPVEIERVMLKGLKRVYPDFSESDLLKVHVFSSRTAAVVCDLNFSKKVPKCRTPLRRLFIAGMPHVYPDERSCNNSIRVATEACRVLGIPSPKVPACASLSGQVGMH